MNDINAPVNHKDTLGNKTKSNFTQEKNPSSDNNKTTTPTKTKVSTENNVSESTEINLSPKADQKAWSSLF